MKKTVDTISASRQRKAKRRYFGAVLALTLCAALTCPALAAGSDPLTIVNNLSDFIFNIIKAVGVIVLKLPAFHNTSPRLKKQEDFYWKQRFLHSFLLLPLS